MSANDSSLLFSILFNKRSLRAQTRDTYTYEQLVHARENLDSILEEQREEYEKRVAEEARKAEKISEAVSLIADMGLSVDDLIGLSNPEASSATNSRKKYSPRPPKYKWLDEDGIEKTWTGQGRPPKYLQSKLNSGSSLEEFLIEKE